MYFFLIYAFLSTDYKDCFEAKQIRDMSKKNALCYLHTHRCVHIHGQAVLEKTFSESISPPARPHLCLLHRVFSFQSTWNKTLQSLCRDSACFQLMNQEICEFHDISFIKFFIFHDGKRVTLFPDLEQK